MVSLHFNSNTYWWLVRVTLFMEWGLLRDFLGNIFMQDERYYFLLGREHVRWT